MPGGGGGAGGALEGDPGRPGRRQVRQSGWVKRRAGSGGDEDLQAPEAGLTSGAQALWEPGGLGGQCLCPREQKTSTSVRALEVVGRLEPRS